MGAGQPYFKAQPVAKFLTTQWDTIKINLKGGSNQVCAGGFIFDWCDEFWKGNNNNIQIGGPDGSFNGDAFAGGYWDEAGFGITSVVNQSTYGQGKPNISRSSFKGYDGVKAFYGAASDSAGELYLTGTQIAAIQSDIQKEIHMDRKELKGLRAVDVPREASLRRYLQVRLQVLHARLVYPIDEVLQEIDENMSDDGDTFLSKGEKRSTMQELHARLAQLQAGG
jgi:hypothetical protein